MAEGTSSQGTEDMTYPTNPVDVNTPPPISAPPPRPAAYGGGAAAALAVVAYLLGQPVVAAVLMVVAEGILILFLAAMPYTGPIIPPPPPPTRSLRPLIATAAILFGLAVLGFGLQSRLGFLGAGVAGIAAALGGLLLPGGRTAAAPPAGVARR